MPLPLLIVLAAVYGAAVGALVPRVAHRMSVAPGEPWRARCPEGHPIVGPAAGWLGTARCARDATPAHGPYGPSTPLLCGMTAVVCAALAAAGGARPELAVWLLMAPVAVTLATVDGKVNRLPDALTLPLAGAAVALLALAARLPGAAGSWGGALLGGLALGAFYLALFVINPSGMGFGDVKLATGLGVALGWYGWGVLLAGGFAGLLLGAFYGVGLLLARRGGRGTAMPFGPFMIVGTFAGVLLGASAAG